MTHDHFTVRLPKRPLQICQSSGQIALERIFPILSCAVQTKASITFHFSFYYFYFSQPTFMPTSGYAGQLSQKKQFELPGKCVRSVALSTYLHNITWCFSEQL